MTRPQLSVGSGKLQMIAESLEADGTARSRFARSPASFLRESGVPVKNCNLPDVLPAPTSEMGNIDILNAVLVATVAVGVYAAVAYVAWLVTCVVGEPSATTEIAGITGLASPVV